MKQFTKYFFLLFPIIFLTEITFYESFRREKATLENDYAKAHLQFEAEKTHISESLAPLNEQQIIAAVSQWFNRETGNVYNFHLVFFETGVKMSHQKYQIQNILDPAVMIRYSKLLHQKSNSDGLTIATIIQHDTGNYFLKVSTPHLKMVRPFMYVQGNFPPEETAALDFYQALIDAPEYIHQILIQATLMLSYHSKRNNAEVRSSLKQYIQGYQIQLSAAIVKLTDQWSTISKEYERKKQLLEYNYGTNKVRIFYYFLTFLLVLIVRFIVRVCFGTYRLITGPQNQSALNDNIADLERKKRNLKALGEQAIRSVEINCAKNLLELNNAHQKAAEASFKSDVLPLLKNKLLACSAEEKLDFINQFEVTPKSIKDQLGNYNREIDILYQRILALNTNSKTPAKVGSLLQELEEGKKPDQIIQKQLNAISAQLQLLHKQVAS